ncbi:hypothetical protein HRED_02890 [Candidatus Haloredivivus sp. G17]|nr:hypothetical protein HRED_02890 [Candidatus Haloredivivus sp. G17]
MNTEEAWNWMWMTEAKQTLTAFYREPWREKTTTEQGLT